MLSCTVGCAPRAAHNDGLGGLHALDRGDTRSLKTLALRRRLTRLRSAVISSGCAQTPLALSMPPERTVQWWLHPRPQTPPPARRRAAVPPLRCLLPRPRPRSALHGATGSCRSGEPLQGEVMHAEAHGGCGKATRTGGLSSCLCRTCCCCGLGVLRVGHAAHLDSWLAGLHRQRCTVACRRCCRRTPAAAWARGDGPVGECAHTLHHTSIRR